MPTARTGLVAAAINGKIYAFGGFDGTQVTNIIEVYDPATDKWSLLGSVIPHGFVDGTVFVSSGRVILGASVSVQPGGALQKPKPMEHLLCPYQLASTLSALRPTVTFQIQKRMCKFSLTKQL
jgi:hypothetical protein